MRFGVGREVRQREAMKRDLEEEAGHSSTVGKAQGSLTEVLDMSYLGTAQDSAAEVLDTLCVDKSQDSLTEVVDVEFVGHPQARSRL